MMTTTTLYNSRITGFIILSFFVSSVFSQPLFYLPDGLTYCPNEKIQIDMLVPDMFDSYTWNTGNGSAHQGYLPPEVFYEEKGTYALSLTISDDTPFRVIDKITVTRINNSWDDAGACDVRPDLHLNIFNASGGTFYMASPIVYNTFPPVDFFIDGILTREAFRIAVWEYDFMIAWPVCWNLSGEDLGYVLVPANITGDTLFQAANNLEVVITTKLVTSTTFHLDITLTEGIPVITCQNDTLDSGDSTATAWYNDQNILVGAGQTFLPSQPGNYYVERVTGTCNPRSHAVSWPCNTATGIEKEIASSQIRTYPNPADRQLFVTLPQPAGDQKVLLQMTDITGRSVFASNSHWESSLEISLPPLPEGTYILRIQSDGKAFAKHIRISR
ncbi:MAG: T9SS type A sorting domain-containing protein [Bacteroidia bacterium]